MSAPSGRMVLTQSSLKSDLERLNRNISGQRTWGSMYGAVNYAEQAATAPLVQDYAESMAEAYRSSLQNQAAVQGSNVGTGYKEYAIGEIDDALNQAYDQYLQNYMQNKANVTSQYDKYRSEISDTLGEQADYVKRYEQAHLDYLKELYRMHESGELAEKGYYDPFEEAKWAKYLQTDAEGNVVGLLDENTIRSNLFDAEGNLTDAGIDFYEQMELDLPQREENTYNLQDYLRTNKDYQDVADWVTGQYAFSYDPDKFGATTGQSVFNTLFGRMSDDTAYTFAERKYGMSEGQLSAQYDTFNTTVEKINGLIDDRADAKDVDAAIDELKAEYERLAREFGKSSENFEAALEQVKSLYREYRKQSVSSSARGGFSSAFATAVAGAGIGTAIGGPGIGTAIGALIGVIAGGAGGSIYSTEKDSDYEKQMRASARDAFNSAIASFMNQ